MMAYKGFNQDLACTCGSGVYSYTPGQTVREEDSKAGRSGFHYSEYPPECFTWYPIDGKNRYFLVEAAGSIDEEQGDVSSCTELTLVEELSVRKMALHTLMYLLEHPRRPWKKKGKNLDISEESAECMREPGIAIARGRNPKARGCAGTILGLLKEGVGGEQIVSAHVVGERGIRPGVWYGIIDGEVKRIEAEIHTGD